MDKSLLLQRLSEIRASMEPRSLVNIVVLSENKVLGNGEGQIIRNRDWNVAHYRPLAKYVLGLGLDCWLLAYSSKAKINPTVYYFSIRMLYICI